MLAALPEYGNALAHRVLLETQLGSLEQAETYMQRIRRLTSGQAVFLATGGGYFAAEAARMTGNRRWAGERPELCSAVKCPCAFWDGGFTSARLGLGLVAAEEQDVALAAEQYAAVEPVNRSLHATSRFAHPGHHRPGRRSARTRPWRTSRRRWLSTARRATVPELAWTCCDYADLLRQRNGPGDGERAAALLEEGLVIARDLGMRPLMERILSRREFLKA